MKILFEHAVHQDLASLDEAWGAGESFILLPEKVSTTPQWLEDALAKVPSAYANGHFLLLTSGSTGSPKLIIACRKRAEQLASVLHLQQQSEPVKETIVLLPLSYSYSFVNQWLWTRTHQRKLKMTDGLSDPKALGEVLANASDAMICLVGVQLPLLISHLGGSVFPGVIRIHFAGGRFPQERLDPLRAMFPNAQVFNNYGCAEAMPRLTLRRAEDAEEAANIGRPLPGIELKSDADHALLFRSPYGAVAMIEDGTHTAISNEKWIPTGDLGEQTADGSWRLLGRANEVFKRHGEKVSLQTLSSTVSNAWPGQFAFYREIDRLGEEGCVLALAPAASAEALQKILLGLRKQHVRAQWPLRVENVDSLPLLPNGKPDSRALPCYPGKSILWQQHI